MERFLLEQQWSSASSTFLLLVFTALWSPVLDSQESMLCLLLVQLVDDREVDVRDDRKFNHCHANVKLPSRVGVDDMGRTWRCHGGQPWL